VKDELERVEIPGEDEARAHTWAVVEAAYGERQPAPRPSHWPRVAAVALAVAAVLAASLTPPGRAVIDEIREVVGVERAEQALFSVPAPGRLLVASDAGVWVVQQDGSRRPLEGYREATWSPFGRFVAAVRENELAALEPDGKVRWTLPRSGVRFPRWTGTVADTRIAYLSERRPRVVAGDGTDDRAACLPAVHRRRTGPAWRPGTGFALALAAPSGAVHVYDVNGCKLLLRSAPIVGPRRLEWSGDGKRLLVVTQEDVRVLDADTASVVQVIQAVEAAFRPGSSQLALIRRRGEVSELVLGNRVVFRGAGELRDLAWSPNGKWLLVTWPTADQWVFVRADGRGIRAVSNISEQFRSLSFPRIDGWCCAP
jgi:hypothetical protein